ncbi:mitochondrial calcium uniporter regulator 1-like isoform X1 [Littorina saxatilis]|uniref:mitochondrial calcium uniporter regulator 1-like isoform X1 n=1 Tax=Littorina saxatilis TaxID=31220 RepID=UPI0038B51C22
MPVPMTSSNHFSPLSFISVPRVPSLFCVFPLHFLSNLVRSVLRLLFVVFCVLVFPDEASISENSYGVLSRSCIDFEFGKSVTVDARRVDPTTVKQVYYFDSLSIVKSLETKGFSREQAEGLAESWTEIINTTLDHQSRHMITKKQQEITVQQLMAEIVSVKKDMVLLQKSEFSQLRSETEKMAIELDSLRKSFVDEVNKLKGHVTLDINLERGRSVEAHATNAGKLLQLDSKMDTDIANLKTTFEQYRNDVLKFAGGTVLACATLCMGIIRLWY